MRIVGGIYRSRQLVEFKAENIRPTSDKVRESLFNVLNNRVIESNFLDLFCGTGAIGIEALSRGAKKAYFNDLSKDSLKVLKTNLEKLGVSQGYEISNINALDKLKTTDGYDIIYIDPPYKSDLGLQALNLCSGALNDGGTVIFEDEKPFVGEVAGLVKTKEKKYGRTYLTFFEKGE